MFHLLDDDDILQVDFEILFPSKQVFGEVSNFIILGPARGVRWGGER
jgi:hypothetical protein